MVVGLVAVALVTRGVTPVGHASFMAKPKSQMQWYRLQGRVVASRLPEGELIPNLKIWRNPEAARAARAKNLTSRSGREGGGWVSASPSEITTESDTVVELRIKMNEEREHDLVRVAQERFIRPLVAALVIVTGKPAHVELIRTAKENPDGTVVDTGERVWTDWAWMYNAGMMPTMDGDERARVVGAMGRLHSDKVAAAAGVDLVEAAKMSWTAGGRSAEVEAAVLRNFLVVERIATRVAAKRPVEAADEEPRLRIIDNLAQNLRTQTPSQAARRIKNAAAALEQQQGLRLARDIDYTCTRLSLDDETRESAHSQSKLRNQSLAHPGKPQPHRRLAASAKQAGEVAESFLRAYVQSGFGQR